MSRKGRNDRFKFESNLDSQLNQTGSSDSSGSSSSTGSESINTSDNLMNVQRQSRGSEERGRGGDNGTNAASQGATDGDDTLVGSRRSDSLSGAAGNDTLVDASGVKGNKSDAFNGGDGNDSIFTHFGSDTVNGGAGDDVISSRSDAGEPTPAQGGASFYQNQSNLKSNDKLTGGDGADTFEFRFDLDARPEILAKHQLAHAADEHGGPSVIDWEGVTGENGSTHLHWVQSIGTDTITDYTRNVDKKIQLIGHTVAIASIENNVDADGDGQADDSIIHIKSEQGAAGSHDEDNLGQINVLNVADINAAQDIDVHDEAHLGAFESMSDMPAAMRDWDDNDDSADGNAMGAATAGADTLVGSKGRDWLDGGAGDDTLVDASGQRKAKADVFKGGDGNDTIYLHWGSDKADGGAGNDTILSRADAGEPVPTQNAAGQVNSGQPFSARQTNDTLTGGTGADTFQFRFDIDAKASILAKHLESHTAGNDHAGPGTIDWAGVTGENNNVHDHWVQSIGSDTITDFNRAEGDRIDFYGHTVAIASIEAGVDADMDGQADDSIIHVKSDQGAAGAHDEDVLGQVNVLNVNNITAADVTIHAEVHLGAFGSIDDMYVV